MTIEEIEAQEIRTWLRQLAEQLRAADGVVERDVATTLDIYGFAFATGSAMPSVESSLQYLGTVTNSPDFIAKQRKFVEANPDLDFHTGLPPEATEWGLRFLKQILGELRKAICAKNSEYSKLKAEYKSYPKAFAAALATGTLASLGVSGPMALGIATFVLLVLATATKNAFCTMTDEEALKAVQEAVKPKRRTRGSKDA